MKELQDFINDIHRNARSKGWWDQPRNTGEAIALMHSELSEALEAVRKGNPQDDKVPFDALTVELADCVIRIFDYCGGNHLPLVEALIAKHEFNKSRPYKHGKKF